MTDMFNYFLSRGDLEGSFERDQINQLVVSQSLKMTLST